MTAGKDITGARVLKAFKLRGERLEPGRYLAPDEVSGIPPRNRRALVEKSFLKIRPVPEDKTDFLGLLDLLARLDRTPQMDEGLRSRLKERLISLLPPRSRGVPEFHQAWMLWGDKKVFLEQVPEGLTSLDLIRASMFHEGIEAEGYKKAGQWTAERSKGTPWQGGAETMRKAYDKVQKALPEEHRRKRTHRQRHPVR